MTNRVALASLCCAAVLAGCPSVTPEGAACEAEAPCPSGYICDPTGHCATQCPAGLEVCGASCVAAGSCAADFTLPGAPTNLLAVGADLSATVSWSAPASNGGTAIIGYTVTSTTGGLTVTTTGATSATITGLVNGTSYTFTVHATNVVGSGPESSPSNLVTPLSVPGAPLNVTALASDQAAQVFWAAPPDDGGARITSYLVTASPGGATMSVMGSTTLDFVGLTNGTAYTFVVSATNAAGTGPASASSEPVIPFVAPTQPTNVRATSGAASAMVTWTAPVESGSGPITGYLVAASPGGMSVTTTGATSALVTGLTNGTSYAFTVVASNALGDSPPSVPSNAVIPAAVPDTPTGVLASPGLNQATVTWTAPASNGSAIVEYDVSTSPSTGVTRSGTTTTTVAGLMGGVSYTFTVTATNSVGTSAPSEASNAVTPFSLPGAPTDVVAVPGDQQATISWAAAVSLTPVLSYTITESPGGLTVPATGTSAVVPGLTNGQAYTFTVFATNTAGNGPPSVATTPVTPALLPGAPTIVSAIPGNAQVTLAWSAPGSGGDPITGYTVSASPGGAMRSTAGTSLAFTGLTNGQSYTFVVFATNATGDGPVSAVSPAVTPFTVPGAPVITSVTSGNGQLTVAWTAPASTGGSPITGYNVTALPGPVNVPTSGATTATITGLTNGTKYTCMVTAMNAAGTGPASAASAAVAPATIPGAPLNPTAVAGVDKATVSWSAPPNGGSPITGYAVTPSPAGQPVTFPGTQTVASITNLAAGATWAFTVTATNAVGTGPASASTAPVTLPTVPGVPTNILATAGAGSALVSWTAPTSTGGSAITGYVVTASPGGAMQAVTGITTTSVSGLTNGTSYTFVVVAVNLVGQGGASAPSNAVTPVSVPGAPTNVSATDGNSVVTVSWTPPLATGGTPITGYEIYASGVEVTNTSGSATSAAIGGLTIGTSYTFVVVATNAQGQGPGSSPSAAVIPVAVPGAPTGVTATAGNAKATVAWTPPVSNGGETITSYTVTASPGGASTSTSATSAVVAGLAVGQTYTFTVTATNPIGTGAPSAASSPVSTWNVPNAPTNVTGTPSLNEATVTWTAPLSNGTPITGYTVTESPGGAVKTAATNSAVFMSLTSGSTHTFTVFATNAIGDGPPSAPSAVVTIPSAPGAPTNVTASPGNGEILVTWTAAPNNGNPISSSTITTSPGGTIMVVAGTATSITVTGLVDGVDYSFTVFSTNAAGSGPASAPSTPAAPVAPPGTPVGVTAVAGTRQVVVSWSAPSGTSASDAVASYLVTGTPGSLTMTTTGTSVTFTGLANGTTYSFTVYATNGAGSGPGATAVATTPNLPVEPSLSVQSGVGSLQVSWAPNGSGSSPITSYTYTVGSTSTTVSSSTTSATVTGLTAGATYSVSVYATSAIGNSATATASATVWNIPGAPTNLSATGGVGQATVTWTAPSSNGGTAITGYTVTSSPGNFTATTTGATTATVTGLAANTSYTFTLYATNAVGNGPSSAPSGSITTSSVQSGIQVSPSSITADGHSAGTLTVTLGNGSGAPLVGVPVSIFVSEGGNMVLPSQATTNSSGVYTATLRSTVIGPREVIVTGGGIKLTTTIHFVPIACTGTLSFAAWAPVAVGANAQGFAVADFNRDGLLDVAVMNTGGTTVNILLGNGAGGFTNGSGSPITVGSGPWGGAAADFNGDGYVDLAISNENSGTVSILLGNGSGGFSTGAPISVGGGPSFLAIGDFNADGYADIAVSNFGSDAIDVELGNGSGGFSAAPGSPITIGSNPTAIVAADFNGDGILDLAAENFSSGNVSVLLGTGTGAFTGAIGSPVTVGSEPGGLAAADLNGDGNVDLIVSNQNSGTMNILLGNGSGGFSNASGSPITVGGTAWFPAPGDFNGDGYLDLAIPNESSDFVGVLQGNGTGTFTSFSVSPLAVTTNPALVSGDFNGDGKLDFVVASQYGDTVTTYLNTCP